LKKPFVSDERIRLTGLRRNRQLVGTLIPDERISSRTSGCRYEV